MAGLLTALKLYLYTNTVLYNHMPLYVNRLKSASVRNVIIQELQLLNQYSRPIKTYDNASFLRCTL